MRPLSSLKMDLLTTWTALLLFLCVGVAGNDNARAESEEIEYRNKIALFGGVTQESSDLIDGSLALAYERLFSKLIGVGSLVEFTGGDVERSWLVLVPVYIHPYAGWFIDLGPGIEFEGSEGNFIFRAGVGYEFELWHRWALAPEFNVDLVGGGDTKLVYGLTLVYSF